MTENPHSQPAPPAATPARRTASPLRKALLVVVFASSIFCGVAWWTSGPREPVRNGRPLSRMLYQCDTQMDFADSAVPPVLNEILAMGPDAARWLAWAVEHGQKPKDGTSSSTGLWQRLDEINQPDPTWWRKLFHRRFDAGYDERKAALWVLGMFGPNAAPALPSLERWVSGPDEERACKAADLLCAIGPVARPAIGRGFRESTPRVRRAFVNELPYKRGNKDEPGRFPYTEWDVSFLLSALADPDEQVHRIAFKGLSASLEYVAPSDAVIHAFTGGLADPSLEVRSLATQTLPRFGAKATPAIPRLIALLDDPDSDRLLRFEAMKTLGKIDRVEKRSKARLQELSGDTDPDVSVEARKALKQLELPPGPPPHP